MNKLVINLPHRSDRMLIFDKEYKHLFDDEYIKVDGVVKPVPFHGIADAHLNCIRMAKEKGWEKVLIMEDDLYVPGKEKARQYFDLAMRHLPEKWDILLGGVYWSKALADYNNYWSKTLEFAALHLYIVNHTAYDKILSYDYTQHIDRWIGASGLNCYVMKKFVAIQYDGYSDNVKKETKYNKQYLHPYKIVK